MMTPQKDINNDTIHYNMNITTPLYNADTPYYMNSDNMKPP
jgi:hypothetical protein